MIKQWLCSTLCSVMLCMMAEVCANEWFVAAGAAGNGNGSSSAPFATIQTAIDIAQAGDVITLRTGTYQEALRSRRDGRAGAPITLRAQPGAQVIIASTERVLDVLHAYFIVDGIIFDGQYGNPEKDTVRIRSSADYFIMRNSEVRRSGRNCVNMVTEPGGVLYGVIIENSLIHHCLRYDPIDGRQDAHGIIAGVVRNLIIRNSEIHTFSGDAVQLDPGRALPGWDNVIIEHCHFWLAPLTLAQNGFPVNTIPGENAVDLKTSNDPAAARASLTIRDLTAHGFRNEHLNDGKIEALLLRENVDLTIDGITVYDSIVAFRLRGPQSSPGHPAITIQNAVIHDVREAFRYDGDIAHLHLYNSTIGANVTEAFKQSQPGNITVRNSLFLSNELPAEAAAHPSNRAVNASTFVDAGQHDYHLQPTASVIDSGIFINGVSSDRDGYFRPADSGFDPGAYEICLSCIFTSGFD